MKLRDTGSLHKTETVWYGAAVKDTQVVVTFFSIKEPDFNRLLQRLPQDAKFQVLEEPNQMLADDLGA